MSAQCRSCGREIVWAFTPAGKRAPLNLEPQEDGNVMRARLEGLVGTDYAYLAVTLSGEPLEQAKARNAELYLNHFSDCPHRKRHAKGEHRPPMASNELAERRRRQQEATANV